MNKKLTLVLIMLGIVIMSLSALAQGKKAAGGMMKEMAKADMWKGYLVDKMCATGYVKDGDATKANTKGAKHTKACALEENCQESGYGLIMDGKYMKFDQGGDKMATDFLNKTKKKDNFLVEVTGTKEGDIVKVKSITEAKSEMMMEKKMEKK